MKTTAEAKTSQAKFDETIYLVNVETFEIDEMTFGEYLREYWSDETTSPRGVQPRLHIEEKEINCDCSIGFDDDGNEQFNEDCEQCYGTGERTVYELRSWGVRGNNDYHLDYFDTEEEAEQERMECWESDYNNSGGRNIPYPHYTIDTAIETIADCNNLSIDVTESIIRKKAIVMETKNARRREFEKQQQEKREALKKAVRQEAATITVDEQFKSDVIAARELKGNDKSKACSVAFVALLDRLNYGKIKSDFWQVFRILTDKI